MGSITEQKLEKGINPRTGKIHWAKRSPHPTTKLRKEGETVLEQACGIPSGQRVPLSEVGDATVAISCGRCAKAHGHGGMEVKRTKPAVAQSNQDQPAKGKCPACDQEVNMRPSGMLAPHKFAGERCDGKAPELPAAGSKPAGSVRRKVKQVAPLTKKQAGKAAEATAKLVTAVTATATSKSHAKALRFGAGVEELGWTVKIDSPSDHDFAEVTATRGDEVIMIEWTDGRVRNGGQHYTGPTGRTVVLRNASAARQMAARTEHAAQEAAAKAATAKPRVGRPRKAASGTGLPSDEVPGANLPFSKDSMPHEILDAIVGRAIAWHNRISGVTQSAIVRPSTKNTVRPGKDGEPVIHFYGLEGGQYAVRVEAIRSVGNKQVETPTTEQRADRAKQRLQVHKAKATVKRK